MLIASLCFQPIIGSVGSRRQGIFSGTEDLRPGILAVVYTNETSSRPWLGQIEAVDKSGEVRIHWFAGSYNTRWRPMTGTASKSSVPRASLLVWGFELTETRQHLRKDTREEIKRLYKETDGKIPHPPQ